MKPMLAHVYEESRITYPCFVQPKLNGVRALYKNGVFQSRDELPFNTNVLRHLSEALLKSVSKGVILDGELYVHGWPLQRIMSAITPVRLQPTVDSYLVEYHIFDTVFYNLSFSDRAPKYNSHFGPNIKCVDTKVADDKKHADSLYADFVSQNYEGMMYRLGDCPYTTPKQHWAHISSRWNVGPRPRSNYLSDKNNRTWHLLKRKNWLDNEFKFISLNETVGELGERGFQMWLLAHNDEPFKVSSGLTRSELDHYLINPPKDKKIKVKYLVLSDKGIPLNATILAIL